MPEAIITTPESAGDPPKLTVERTAGALVVHLSGEWRLTRDLPSLAPITLELESAPEHKIRYDAEALTGWDSSLLAVVDKISQLCKEHKIEEDRGGLPEGMR